MVSDSIKLLGGAVVGGVLTAVLVQGPDEVAAIAKAKEATDRPIGTVAPDAETVEEAAADTPTTPAPAIDGPGPEFSDSDTGGGGGSSAGSDDSAGSDPIRNTGGGGGGGGGDAPDEEDLAAEPINIGPVRGGI